MIHSFQQPTSAPASGTDAALLVFAAAFAGALFTLLGNIVAAGLSARSADKERTETRRKQRLEYLDSKLQALIAIRADLQWYQQRFAVPNPNVNAEDSKKAEVREVNYGKAYSIMMSIDDNDIRRRASEVMDEDSKPSTKLAAIDFAIQRLGDMTMEVVREN